MSTTALTLYEIEDHLVALVDTAEGGVAPEQEEEIFQEIQKALTQAVEKRDRVAQFLAHCENQVGFVDAEIKRLQALKKTFVKAQERMENYVIRTIQALGTDEKGRYRKLEGRTTVFSLRACPPSVEVKNEGDIPAEYKTLTITIPATAWERFVDSVDLDERCAFLGAVKKSECAVDKKGIKTAIDSGTPVPGADVAIGKFSLARK